MPSIEVEQSSPSSRSSPDTAASMKSTKPLRILVVDDDADILFTLKTILRAKKFNVETHQRAQEALANYKAKEYDLLILDVKIPDMNGFRLYQEIKKIDPDAKVCFLSAGETYLEEFKRLFPQLTEDYYMLKPVDAEHLVSRARKIIGKSGVI